MAFIDPQDELNARRGPTRARPVPVESVRNPAVAAADTPLARAAANRVRVPTEGIGGGLPPTQAAPLGAAGEPVIGDAAARTVQSVAKPGLAARGAAAVSGLPKTLAKGAAEALAPGATIAASIDAFDRPTEDYYNRFGLDPKTAGNNGFKDVAVRAGGVISDVGAGILDVGTGAVNAARTFGGAEPIQTFGQIVRAQDNPAPRQTQAPAQAPAPVQNIAAGQAVQQAPTPTVDGSIGRRGNSFSDQRIAGDVTFNPNQGRGGFVTDTTPEITAQTKQANADYFAGQRAEAEAKTDRFNAGKRADIASYAASKAADNLQKTFDSIDPRFRGLNRGGAEVLQTIAQLRAGAGNQQLAPANANEAGAKARGEQIRQSGDAADVRAKQSGNAAAASQQKLLQDIGALPGDAQPGQRRALIDRALVGAGKDPDAGRFAIVDTPSADGLTNLKTAIDTRTGELVGANKAEKPTAEQAKSEALAAVKAGKDKNLINARLKALGFDTL